EARDNDAFEAGRGNRVKIGARQHAALFQRGRAELQAMRQDRAFCLADRNLTEFHAPSDFSPRRSICVIWPRIETAISAGEPAPVGRRMGPWMRPRSASVKPISFSRSQRAACVRFEPSAPI